MDDFLVKFDLLQREADGRTQPGRISQGAFVASCLQNASLSRTDKPLVLSGMHGNFGIAEIAQHMRLLLGPMGGSGQQEIVFVGGGDEEAMSSQEEDDFGVWLAKRERRRKRTAKLKGEALKN